jgi:hypothetical protein
MTLENPALEALLRERSDHRQEIVSISRAQQHAVVGFITVLAMLAGVYWGRNVTANPESRNALLFFLTQVEVFVLFYQLSLFANISAHARYVAELEEHINEHCGPVSLWESRLCLPLLYAPRGSFFWSLVAMGLLGAALFSVAIGLIFATIDSFFYGVTITTEIVAFLAALVLTASEPARTNRFIRGAFGGWSPRGKREGSS